MTTDAVPHGTSTEPTAQADPAQGATTTEPPSTEPVVQGWEAEARKWEKRAKDNGAKAKEFGDKAKELDTLRQASMSEAEKAVAEAEKRGHATATSEFSQRLVRSQFDALAGRRNPDVKTDEILEIIDLSKFVGEDGEPDSKAIQDAVERLVPEAAGQSRPPGFDSGSRTPPPKQSSMSDRIRQQAGRA